MAQGATTVIVPTGGTEQNGPHMALGKHNFIVRATAEAIARKLGNALVAPVIAYVPEGNITPPEGHMRYAGTLSISEQTYESLLEDTARSLKQHGFTLIAFIGDSGGNQEGQARIAEKLSHEWSSDHVRVLHVGTYYDSRANGQRELLEKRGFSSAEIGTHGAIADTSECWAVYLDCIRKTLLEDHSGVPSGMAARSGSNGNAKLASRDIGTLLLEQKINAAVNAISKIAQAEGAPK